MDWSAIFVPEAAPQLLAAAGMLALAAWLVTLDPRNGGVVAFALFLVLRAVRMFAGVAGALVPSYEDQAFWANVGPYFNLAALPALAYFACVYPTPLRGLAGRRWNWVPFAAAALLFVGLYVYDHALDWSFTQGDDGRLTLTRLGPLSLVGTLLVVSFGFLALLFMWRYVRAPDRARHTSLLLVAVGFELNALHDATGLLLGTSPNVARPEGLWAEVGRALYLVELVPAALAAGLLLAAWLREKDPALRGTMGRLAMLLPLPVLSNVLALVLDASAATERFLNGTWRLSMPLFVTYALVRYRLFDIDLAAKATIRRGTVASAFVAVFFVVSESAANFLGDWLNSAYVGLVAAGLLIFLLHPLYRLADRVAEAAMPEVADTAAWRKRKREEAYRAAVEFVLADGRITIAEHRRLMRMAERLGLPERDEIRVRREVERALGWVKRPPEARGSPG